MFVWYIYIKYIMIKTINIKVAVSSFVLILFSLFLSSIAIAQAPPPRAPSGDNTGAQATRFKDASELEKKRLDYKKPKAPQVEIEEEAKKPPVEGGPSFVLKEVKVTGSTLFEAGHFRKDYESYLDKKVTYQDLNDIAAKIKYEYKKLGYLTTNVYIPEQEVAAGSIEMRILEGTVGEVKIEGNKWFSDKLIRKYFHAKKNEILNVFKLSRDLLRLNQNSDLEVRSVIGAGKDPGSSDLTLKVKDKFPYHAGTAFDNQGTRLVGRLRTSLSFRSTNMLGQGDSIFFNTVESALSQGNFVSYLYPIDTYGTKVGFDAAIFTNKLGKQYKVYDITGNTQIYTPKITSEMYLTEDMQINTEGGMDIKSSKKWILGAKNTDDQLRIPYINLDITKMDSFAGGGQTSFLSQFRFSTADFLGASGHNHTSASRPGTGGFFFAFEQTIRRIQRMPADSYLSMKCMFQNATHSLPSSEQMQLGGAYYIRGYPEGDYLADEGISLNVDWVFPLLFVPKDFKLPYSTTPLCHQIEPVVFMDMGAGRLKKFGPGERETKFLMGIGGGLRVQINRNLFLRLDWAERVGDRPSQGQGPSNFNISFQGEI
jgi:hemolysin activation/secretion protein